MNIRRAGTIFVIFGLVLIFAALSLFFCNAYQEKQAYKETETVLRSLEKEVSSESMHDAEEASVQVGGYAYIGYIEIPKIKIKLPVLSEWDYARLKIAPCRQFGSIRTGDLVIAAHNYKKHFGKLSSLCKGDAILLTDIGKHVHAYAVEKMEVLGATDVEKVQNSGYALVLYTCTYGGKARVAVFCGKSAAQGNATPTI